MKKILLFLLFTVIICTSSKCFEEVRPEGEAKDIAKNNRTN